MNTPYHDFLNSKLIKHESRGLEVKRDQINPVLFDFQRDLTWWALKKGRAAIFADTGLGKSFMQIEWARLLDCTTLIVAPLSVARQTVHEARKIGVNLHYTRGNNLQKINITNYEMIDHFDPADFQAIVLDESSILKGLTSKTRVKLIDMFRDTPYRLCCTATPAPNDISEIANHAEFLGIMSRANMLSSFFVHDQDGWRLKGHAEESFYKWLASWGMSVKKPSDLGYSDDGYILPDLNIDPVFIKTPFVPDGQLFWIGLKGIGQRAEVRKQTAQARVEKAVEIINQSNEQWIVWCGLNSESNSIAKLIDGSIEVQGQDPAQYKAKAIEDFQDGEFRVLITKPKIAGFGMNLQNCNNMAFVGLSDSWEIYYQCIRRCWRFGQRKPVNVNIVLSDAEMPIYENVQRKEREAMSMTENLVKHVAEFERAEIGMDKTKNPTKYKTDTAESDSYTLMLGDSAERLKEVENDVIGLSIFSPPFMSLYTYSPTERDIGNSDSEKVFFDHFGFITDELLRATMPGRNCCVHVAQIPAMLVRDGYIGMKDFRGKTILHFENRGWIFHGEITIDKDPQAQAIRTHSKGLTFTQLKKDASWLRPALADYILVFRKPGDNPDPIIPNLTNNEWIKWARPIWYGIKETDTLNFREARENRDERHICPLQLGTIERCVMLWSNFNDIICSPFMGIGSEGYKAVELGRRFIGIELKESYYQIAVKNIEDAVNYGQQSLFKAS